MAPTVATGCDTPVQVSRRGVRRDADVASA